MTKALAAVLGLLCVTLPAPLFAQAAPEPTEAFYIEVGNDIPAATIDNAWKDLVATHKTQLSKLKLFPKKVASSEAADSVRIQAGPITTKIKAQKICNRLFADHMPCFVIEGMSDGPPSSMSNLSDSSSSIFGQGEDVSGAPPVSGYVQLPWLVEQSPEREAELHVAEAIRVAPTEQEDDEALGKPIPIVSRAIENTQIEQVHAAYYDESEDSGPGWLIVQSFLDEEMAHSFWDEVRAGLSGKDKELHVRIIRPLKQQQDSKAPLYIGQFPSSHAAYEFCRKHIQAEERGLNCAFNAREPGANTRMQSRYEARRRPIENPAIAGEATTPYWVKVLSAPTQAEAQNQWEVLRHKKDDLLGNVGHSVVASPEQSAYSVYAGPFDGEEAANGLCDNLKSQGWHCGIVQFSAK